MIQKHGLYDLVLSMFQTGNPSNDLIKMVQNKKYNNIFNREIKDMVSFERKYLRYDRDLIPLESLELMEYKPKGWEKEFGEKFGLSLSIKSYLTSGAFKGSDLNSESILYFKINLEPDFDSQILSKDAGEKIKFGILEKLSEKYNNRLLKDNEFDVFVNEFLNAYNKPSKYYHEKYLSRLNEEKLPDTERESVINQFVDFVFEKLGIDTDLPRIIISYDSNEAKDMKSFGKCTPTVGEIRVVAANRNLADVLRTLAHELVHYKQFKEGRLKPDSSETGSEHENEANSLAGVFLREFGQKNPIIFE